MGREEFAGAVCAGDPERYPGVERAGHDGAGPGGLSRNGTPRRTRPACGRALKAGAAPGGSHRICLPRIFIRSLYAPITFLPGFYDPVAKLQGETIQRCFVMDGIYLIVLIGFAVLSAALLGLCAALAPNAAAGGEHGTPHHQMPGKNSASDRGL